MALTASERKNVKAVEHVVHDYANFVSSGSVVLTGRLGSLQVPPPLNTYVWHAYLVSCRKMGDFFGEGGSDDVNACRFVRGFKPILPVSRQLKRPINKQLAHLTYTRITQRRTITAKDNADLHREIQGAWRMFLSLLKGTIYEVKFDEEIHKRATREFSGLNLR